MIGAAIPLATALIGAAASGGGEAPPEAATRAATRQGRTAQDFEAMILEQMFGHMLSGVQGDGPLGAGGTGGEAWRSLLTGEYAKGVARAGGIGIAAQVQGELLRLQEGFHANR